MNERCEQLEQELKKAIQVKDELVNEFKQVKSGILQSENHIQDALKQNNELITE